MAATQTIKVEIPKPLPPLMADVAANDNDKNEAFSFIRKAVNAPTVGEVDRMIDDKIAKFHFNKYIELKIGDGAAVKLPEEPRHFLFGDILTPVSLAIPCALVGPAGSGKSTVAEQVAKALGFKYYLQNSVSGVHEVAGYMDAHGKYNTTTFRTAFEKGGLMLIDEVDTSDPSALKWLNTALAQGYAMFPDQPDPVHRHRDFRVLIAANTYGTGADRLYVGANQLDASTLDRFVFIDFGYDEEMEKALCGNTRWAKRVQAIRRGAQKEKARIVVSPRASIYGAKLLAAGWPEDKVADRVIWKGIDKELQARIEKAIKEAA